jgi:radical SAM superfamily enzyme YgiQ (UPF0313 family)
LIDEKVFPPLGLMSVGTALKQQGHDVVIHDGSVENVPADFEYYGFGPTTPEYAYALDALRDIKRSNPAARVVIGGPYATLNPNGCLHDGFDCAVAGDGEMAAQRAFSNGARHITAVELPLGRYPIIDRTILDLNNYLYFLNGRMATTMLTSQGCPYKCGFCCKTYQTVRFKSISRVIEEIDILHHDFGYNALAFPEDLFIINRSRTETICDHLANLGIIWRCLIRADLLVKYGNEFVEKMAKSGCAEVGMGIESGSDKILATVNKGENVETIKQAVRMLKTGGIRVKGFFIVGLPGEDEQSLAATRSFLEEMQLDALDIKIYQPYPGTPIWENRSSYDLKWDDDIDFGKKFYKGRPGEYFGNIRTEALTTDQIYRAWVDMEAEFTNAG